MSFSSWFTNTPNKPSAQPTQPQELEDMTQGSQTAPSEPAKPEMAPTSTADKTGSETVVASAGEQEKQREDAQAATGSQAPGSTPPTSDEKAPPTPGLEPLNEKAEGPEPTTTTGGPPGPDINEYRDDRQLELRRSTLLRTHTRLAKFFTWLLLLGFVILPSTFGKTPQAPKQGENCLDTFNNNRNSLGNTALLPIGYVCCILNLLATLWLWRQRSNDARWLYANLFFAGLTNAFSGLVTTLAGAFGARGGFHSTASKTTLAFSCICTGIYGALSLIYRKRVARQGAMRGSIASGMAV